ncbi:MAG: pyruvate, water dikinase [Candidatus Berkelbacteria bacterium Licking1014_7]|uniref:Phosphoenolpyruvate synthase n=1 Tax=Candidatus Berkelbacteria bacterium Licking1014_7 TaxID=2017147 RepID=A0A554LK45_9BACT|nr:MAG: pyruvate, water dikinase [Candidatus Berkelbacteria bacterium Licking1014_7]
MPNILWLKQIGKNDIQEAGGKGANLGELVKAGINIPDGFVITASAYFNFLNRAKLDKKIQLLLSTIDPENSQILNHQALEIQKLILSKEIPKDLENDIIECYQKLGAQWVAVRSSATAEDLKGASFAGQQKTFLNVSNKNELIKAVRQGYASLFEARAIYYRAIHNFDHLDIGMALVVQKMVQSDSSGILFTVNPLSGKTNEIMIEAGKGLGEPIVAGSVTPDQFIVDKKTLAILKSAVRTQDWKMIYQAGKNAHIKLTDDEKNQPKITLDQIHALSQLAKKIENHFRTPQDCEWAIEKNQLFFVQSRPITTLEKKMPAQFQLTPPAGNLGKELLHGIAGSAGIAWGKVNIIHSPQEIDKIEKGDILVTEMTDPSYVPAMRKAKAIVTDTGGATSHAAIVSREIGIPAVVGTNQATHILTNNQIVTVDGINGVIYQGKIANQAIISDHKISSHPNSTQNSPNATFEIPTTATKVYINLGEPDLAQKTALLPSDGVGLLRAEFMIAGLGKHPKLLIENNQTQEYISELEEGIRKIAVAFSPRPVVYRATDFKTNEYRGLEGGEKFEPEEENPMLGFRGAARYIAEPEIFQLELKALWQAREKYGLDNIHLMIPFVRTPDELKEILAIIEKTGLKRSNDFKIWMMVEIPANVWLIDEFLNCGIDGISIGSNDLTQLMLGVDRDNGTLNKNFDERNKAVIEAMEYTVKKCRALHKTSSICGNAASVYPEVLEAVVRAGITSVSITADVVIQTRRLLSSIEKRIVLEKNLK